MPNSGFSVASNLDRGWLVALVWRLGTQAEGEIKMLAGLGTIFYWCCLAIAFACWIAAIIIMTAIFTGKPSDSEVWMASFLAAAGVVLFLAGLAAKPEEIT